MIGIYFSGTGNAKFCDKLKLIYKNISIKYGKAVAKSSCTMCYRCISNCPNQAITLIGKQVIEQCRIEKYLD